MVEPFARLAEVDETRVSGNGLAKLLSAMRQIRASRPDVFLVPFPSNRWQYSMLALLSGATFSVLHGYPAGYWRALGFVGIRVPAKRGLHDVEQNMRLLTVWALNPGCRMCRSSILRGMIVRRRKVCFALSG